MITRVEISGFKSFQDFALDVEPLFMVLGPNSAGKSNLFDALALISRFAQMELSKALQGGRGSIREQFSRTADGTADTMSFAIELLLAETNATAPLAQTRFRYELRVSRTMLSSGIEALNVVHEWLRPITQTDDEWIRHHRSYARFARYDDAGEVRLLIGSDLELSIEMTEDGIDTTPDELRELRAPRGAMTRDRASSRAELGGTMIRELPAVVDRTLLAEVGSAIGQHVSAVVREFRSWRFLHLGMNALRGSSERAASARLASDGSNLPTALAALPEEVRARIQADLVELVPGLKSIQVTIAGDDLSVEATFSDGQHYPQRVLSDGTLRLLALLTMLHSAAPGGLVAYEEPENGLFPGRLRELVRRLRELVVQDETLPVQILLNGHSPAIVAGLHDLPDSLAFADLVRRKDGVRRTRVRRIATGAQLSDPATTVSMREVEALLDAAKPETIE